MSRTGERIRITGIQAPDFESAAPCRRLARLRRAFRCDNRAAARSQRLTSALEIAALRENFQYEALFASAVTLAYFTMYLWAMRLLVRLYSTEHHLAIDAKGRVALAETYLSFTSDGDPTKSDRTIMLAVLFRPVIDGMVKDEGAAALSPAAVISGIVSASRQ